MHDDKHPHLLTGITRDVDGYAGALFVLLYPHDNGHVRDAVTAYAACLTDVASFAGWTLEHVTSCLRTRSTADWIGRFQDRYLAFEKIDRYTSQGSQAVIPAQ